MTELVVRKASGEERCPFCHEALGAPEQAWACPGCGTRLHEACARELGRCSVLGCAGRVEERPRPSAGQPVAARVLAGVVGVALAASGGVLLGVCVDVAASDSATRLVVAVVAPGFALIGGVGAFILARAIRGRELPPWLASAGARAAGLVVAHFGVVAMVGGPWLAFRDGTPERSACIIAPLAVLLGFVVLGAGLVGLVRGSERSG